MPADRDDSYSAGQKYFPFAAPLLPSCSEGGGRDDGHSDDKVFGIADPFAEEGADDERGLGDIVDMFALRQCLGMIFFCLRLSGVLMNILVDNTQAWKPQQDAQRRKKSTVHEFVKNCAMRRMWRQTGAELEEAKRTGAQPAAVLEEATKEWDATRRKVQHCLNYLDIAVHSPNCAPDGLL